MEKVNPAYAPLKSGYIRVMTHFADKEVAVCYVPAESTKIKDGYTALGLCVTYIEDTTHRAVRQAALMGWGE